MIPEGAKLRFGKVPRRMAHSPPRPRPTEQPIVEICVTITASWPCVAKDRVRRSTRTTETHRRAYSRDLVWPLTPRGHACPGIVSAAPHSMSHMSQRSCPCQHTYHVKVVESSCDHLRTANTREPTPRALRIAKCISDSLNTWKPTPPAPRLATTAFGCEDIRVALSLTAHK